MASTPPTARTFKTKWFTKAAKKALIDDDALCKAIEQVRMGQADDLGGGVYKKRLDKNRYRSIVLAKSGPYWIYEFLFAKKDRDNIDDDELVAFRKLTDSYALMTSVQLQALLDGKDLVEICNG